MLTKPPAKKSFARSAPRADGARPSRRRPVFRSTRPLAAELERHRTMRDDSTQKIYDLHSRFYDVTFGRLVRRRIGKAIVEQVDLRQGDVVLDVGIGTGGSLDFWPADRGTVVGVDLSGGMLDKAAEKVARCGRENVFLGRANALRLPFDDAAFHHLFVSHVISVVSDPAAVLRECLRVTRPGGRVVLVNHFQSENKLVGTVEKLVCPICTKLGWKSDLALEDLLREVGIEAQHRYKLTKPDLWETVVLVNPAA